MTLWTQAPTRTQSAQESDWLDPTLVQYLSAAGQDADESGPTASLGRLARIAAGASQITGITTAEDESGATVAVVGQPTAEPVPIEEQTERIKAAGLEGQVKANFGYTSAALDTIIDWKSDELRREAIRDAAPAVWGVLGIGSELASSMADPISLASSFLPVVPAARAARMLETAGGAAGRAAARAKIGAIEGGIGALAVEPLVYLGQSQSQADYTMMDSLQNAAFGIIMGAGLQAAGGAIADRIMGVQSRGTTDEISAATAAAERPDGGDGELAGTDVGSDSAPPLVADVGETAGSGTVTVAVPRQRNLKIPGRADEPYEYALVEAEELQSSHIPEAGFQPNPRYELENERRYHAEAASQRKVLDNAAQLDPAFLMDSVDANHGAPVVDFSGNVIGGNGRAMSIRYAYDAFPDRARGYRDAVSARAAEFGLDPTQVQGMSRPVLVRRLTKEHDLSERQALVSALNDTFTDSKVSRTAGKSRGDRLGGRTLDALASGMRDSDSLRQFFDTPESRDVVDMLISDGVIREQDRNALVNADGLLNPDGKRAVEEALRGRVAGSYESLASLPTPVVGKIDAAIPHLLSAEGVGGKWDIVPIFRDAIDLFAEFQASGSRDAGVFLSQLDMVKGAAPADRYSRAAQVVFHLLKDAKKAELATALQRFSGQAKISADSSGLPGIGKTPDAAAREFLGFSMEDADVRLRSAMGELIDRRTEPVDPPEPNVDTATKGELEKRMEREASEYDRALQDAAGINPELASEISAELDSQLSELDADISRARLERDVAIKLAACEANL